MKKIIAFVLTLAMCLSLCGCRRPYDTPEFVTIEPSQPAVLIPLGGDSAEQCAFDSEELLAERKVATKEIQIPHRWVQTGYITDASDAAERLADNLIENGRIQLSHADGGCTVVFKESVLSFTVTPVKEAEK